MTKEELFDLIEQGVDGDAFRELCERLTDPNGVLLLVLVSLTKGDEGMVRERTFVQPLAPRRVSGGTHWRSHWESLTSLLKDKWLPVGCFLMHRDSGSLKLGLFSPFERNEQVHALVVDGINKFLNNVGAQKGLAPTEWVSDTGRLGPWETTI